jgi:hypothetical protein
MGYLFLLFIPLSIGVAILRSGLFDIYFIINRTLVNVPLTANLAGMYSASIALFQKLFIAATGEKSDAAIVLTTLVLASTFTPIRNWLQVMADKRFKEPADATKKLNAFGEQARSFVLMSSAQELARRLLDEAVAAFHAQSGAVYLLRGKQLQIAHAHGDWNDEGAKIAIPLEADGEQIGLLQLGARGDGEDYTPHDQTILKSNVDQVAGAIWLAERARWYFTSGEWTQGTQRRRTEE